MKREKERDDLDVLADRLYATSGREAADKANRKVFKFLFALLLIGSAAWMLYLYLTNALRIDTLAESAFIIVAIAGVITLGFVNEWYAFGVRAGMANIMLRKVSRDMAFNDRAWTVTMRQGDNSKCYSAMNEDERRLFHLSIAIGLIRPSTLLSKKDLAALVEARSAEDIKAALLESKSIIDIDSIASKLSKVKTNK